MTAHKRTKITIQTDKVTLIRRTASVRRWCPKCGCEVDVVDLVQAEALTGMAQPALQDCVNAKKWHSFEGPDGTVLVCLESLLKGL